MKTYPVLLNAAGFPYIQTDMETIHFNACQSAALQALLFVGKRLAWVSRQSSDWHILTIEGVGFYMLGLFGRLTDALPPASCYQEGNPIDPRD